ncbi:MAG: pitrilysin family protein [Bacteroidota bacterium]
MTLSLADRTLDRAAGPARLLLLPTDVHDVVSFRGSFETAPDLGRDDDLVQSLVTDLLPKGTQHRDRFEVAAALEDRGAFVSFYSDGLRAGFSGKCLRDDLADVLALLAEQLREPAFDDAEVEKAIVRAVAGVRRARESTSGWASGALARRLYGLDHPNFVLEPSDEEARLGAITAEEVRAYHGAHFGSDSLTIAMAGDVPVETAVSASEAAFGGWAPHGTEAAFSPEASPEPPGRTLHAMADRNNLDVRIGHAVGVRRDSPAYLPLYVGVFALGGNFSSRLMQTIRDEQGLTYGIRAGLGSTDIAYDGHVRVSVTLSQENLERGIAATQAEVEGFVDDGIGPEALAQVQTTLAGQHVVSLATTGGAAARLLVNAQRGFDVGYLDRYPDLIRDLTEAEVTEAVRQHVRPADLHVSIAGTPPEAGQRS